MDFERIFPFIILLIIWGVSSAIRKSPKENSADKPAGAGAGLLALLQNRIQAALEVAPEEIVDLDHYIEPLADEPAMPQAKIDVSRAGGKRSGAQREGDLTPPSVNEIEAKPCPDRGHKGRLNLKKAIVWAEIIGPPIALRED